MVGALAIFDLPYRIEREQLSRRQAMVKAVDDSARDFELALIRVDEALKRHLHMGYQCDTANIAELRKGVTDAIGIVELGLVNPKGWLICTSWQQPDQPVRVDTPLQQDGLRLFGPTTSEYLGASVVVLSRTRPDGGEVNALMTTTTLNAFIHSLAQQYDFVGIVDARHGTPVIAKGRYSLPLTAQPLFPLTSRWQAEGLFDDRQKRFAYATTLTTLPGMALIATTSSKALYAGSSNVIHQQIAGYTVAWLIAAAAIMALRAGLDSSRRRIGRALRAGEFINHYQPIINSSTGKLAGVEALVRWQHPAEGLLGPSSFLPDAERLGMLVAMTEWQLQLACDELESLLANAPHLRVNINIGEQHLNSSAFIDRVIALRAPLPGLVLELTEHRLIDIDQPVISDSLKRLQAAAIPLALDDFGTGYAGIGYLGKLAVSIIKVDRSFVGAIGSDAPAAQVLDAVIALGRQLNLKVVAEGVETQQQADYLTAAGVLLHQGWLYARAMPADELRCYAADDQVTG
ncbi:MAG: EAL domain-containing protein [Gammaproteobacteria bacterium]|nr:EAL domain-containing protein [Gammaproteobacteria bacterium]